MIDALYVGTGVCLHTFDTFRRDEIAGRYMIGFGLAGLALLVKDLGITQECMAHSEFQTGLPAWLQRILQYSLKSSPTRIMPSVCQDGK